MLDTEDDADFDRLARLAADVFEAPIAAVTLIDAERQWFKSRCGLEFRETPVEHSFSAHAIAGSEAWMVVADTVADQRFVHNPLVTGTPGIRFYAGAPITVRGQKVGALAVAAPTPRAEVEASKLQQLVSIAETASTLFELKNEAQVSARTASDLLREEWRHALTLEAGKVGSWVWDIPSGEMAVNEILRRMYELEPLRPVTVSELFDAIDPADRPALDRALETTFTDGVDFASEFRVKSGRWLIGRGRVYQRDPEGKPLVMMGVNIDVTDARKAADHTRHLLRELNHRVKNTLAMIQSLARQTLRTSADPQEFIDAFSGRLRTLSEAHALLADSDWSGVGLLELIDSEVGQHVLPDQAQIEIVGSDLRLPPDHALGLGLILHELVANAVKYGGLSTPDGRIRIEWHKQAGNPTRLALHWQESGGPMVVPPTEPGLGSRLIQRSLDKVLDSRVTLDFLPQGVEAEISLPLS